MISLQTQLEALQAQIAGLNPEERAEVQPVLEKLAAELLHTMRGVGGSLMSSLPGMAYRCQNTPDYTMEFVSAGCKALTGYEPDDLIHNRRLSYDSLIVPEDRPFVWEKIQAAIGQNRPYRLEYRIRTASGAIKWVWEQGAGVTDSPTGSARWLTGFITDVSDQKALETVLEQRNAQLQSLYEAGQRMGSTLDLSAIYDTLHATLSRVMACDVLFISSYDASTQTITCRSAWMEGQPIDVSQFPVVALTPEGTGTQSLVIRSGRSLVLPDLQSQIKTAPVHYGIRPDGSLADEDEQPADNNIARSALLVPLILENRVTGVIQVQSYRLDAFTGDDLRFLEAIAPQLAAATANAALYQQAQRELVERQEAEAALRTSEQKLRNLIGQSVDGIVMTDEHGLIVTWNQAMEQITGLPSAQATGRPIWEVQREVGSPEERRRYDPERVRQQARKYFEEWPQKMLNQEAEILRPDGTLRNVQSAVFGIKTEQGNAVGAMVRDITDRKQAEEAVRTHLRQMELLNAVSWELTALLDLDALLDHAAVLIQATFKLEHVGLFLLNEEQDRLVMRARAGRHADRFPPQHSLRIGTGMVGWVGQHRQPLLANDVTLEPRYYNPFPDNPIRAEVSLPIQLGEELLGVLDVQSGQINAFNAKDMLVLETLSNQLAIAIQNARLYASERDQREMAEALRDTAAIFSSTLEMDILLQRMLENVGRVVPHDAGSITLISGNEVHFAYWRGYPDEFEAFFRTGSFPLTTPNIQDMLTTGLPVVIPDVSLYPGWVQRMETSLARSYLGVPIRARSEVIGFLNLESLTPGFFTNWHAERLAAFADQAAVAIQNARLYQDLELYNEGLEQAILVRTQELDRARQRVETILNNTGEAILFLDPDGFIRQTNPAFNAQFGYQIDEKFGDSVLDVTSEDTRQRLQAALDQIKQECQTLRLEITARRKNGSTFDSDVTLAPVLVENGLLGVVCSLVDTTTHKQAQAQLQSALEQARELSELRSRFVSTASHEFRTPLTTILSSTFLLENRADRMTDEQKARHFEKIKTSVGHMTQLLEEVLLIGKAEANKMEYNPAPFDLAALCAEVTADIQLHQQAIVIDLVKPESSLPVVMDEKLIRQIITNLLSNAIKYSRPGNHVRFEVTPSAGNTILRVIDTGIGIPLADQKHIFEPFHRADNTGGIQGTGLGLAITRHAVDLHGGTIGFESEEGKGTTFTVRLPNRPAT